MSDTGDINIYLTVAPSVPPEDFKIQKKNIKNALQHHTLFLISYKILFFFLIIFARGKDPPQIMTVSSEIKKHWHWRRNTARK